MRGRGRCRAPLRGCVVIAMGLLWSHAAAAQPSMPPGTVDRGWGGRVRVNGVRMDIRLFEVRQPPLEVADGVARQPGLDPWVLPLSDGVMLSGVRDDRPWLMQFRLSKSGMTHGVLAVGLDAKAGMRALPAEWRPPGATLLLDLQTRDERGKVAHQLYAHAADSTTFSRLLQARLTALGWRAGSGEGLMEWRRARRVLQLVVVAREQGSGLLAVEIEAGE